MCALNLFKKKTDGKDSSNHYMTGKEIREIAKANNKEMRRLEKEKKNFVGLGKMVVDKNS